MSPKELFIDNLQKEYGIDLEGLVADIRRYLPTVNENRIRKAFFFAAEAHQGQLRKDNKPYITHPFESARILTTLHVDEETIIAALLHDVPEDTSFGLPIIEEKFGKKVTFLVDGITKLAKVHYQNDMAQRQIESLKKLFLHTAHDPRIILIKLADRLHNMRTLQYIEKEEKRIRISRETMEIFVPIANLLGIEDIKAELEDLSFRFLLPDEYQSMAERIRQSRDLHNKAVDQTVETIEAALKRYRLHSTVVGRQRNIYSVYKKVINQTRRLAEFDNLISLRIIVQDKDECYKILGIVHSLFKPKPSKFKDYIAVPKINGYQSLHTTVFGVDGITTEIQIRTHEMHLEAEYGIAAHYFHIGGKQTLEEDRRSNWVEKILQLQKRQEQDEDFMDDLRRDVLHDRIFVFTPRGQSIDLPQSGTCIDFAYQIHTEVGHRALKAEVNGVIVPMATALQNGDTVHIITSDNAKGPDRSWLPFARTNTARNRIREYLKKNSMEQKINTGRDLLQKELDRAGLGLLKDIPNNKIRKFCVDCGKYADFNDILIAIGEGLLRPLDFVSSLYPQKSVTLGLMKWLEFPVKNKPEQISHTPISIKITSNDRVGQLERFLRTISALHINALKTKAYISFWTGDLICRQTVAVKDFSQVSELFQNLEQVEGVKRAERVFWQKKLFFSIAILLTFAIWVAHPFILNYLAMSLPQDQESDIFNPLLYAGLLMLFMLIFLLKSITSRSFPDFRETGIFWTMTFLLSGFAVVTILSEIYFFRLHFNLMIVSGFMFIIFLFLITEYLTYRKKIFKSI
jgi:GTP diphosphokinase / guanosine-3',5'-bis(diphosphate) 3'-diphosphatase